MLAADDGSTVSHASYLPLSNVRHRRGRGLLRAAVVHQDRHHAVVLTELFPDTLLDQSPGIVIGLNVCSNSEVP